MDVFFWETWWGESEKDLTIWPDEFVFAGYENLAAEKRLDDPTPFSDWSLGNTALYCVCNGIITDHLDCHYTKIVSSRLKEFLAPILGDEVQFLPIRLQADDNSRVIDGYYIMHVLNVVDCIDLERTPHQKDGPPEDEMIMTFYDALPILRRGALPEHLKIFRVARWGSGIRVAVREDLKNTLKRSHFTGITFTPFEYS